MAKNFEVTCPCCQATIVVDRISGDVLMHKEKQGKTTGSIDEMVSRLETSRVEMTKKFDRELESQKDRKRLLEEKFKEAMERVDRSDTPRINPMDLD